MARLFPGAHFCPFLFSSESGFLHKVVLLAKGPHIIEEIQTFKQPQTVKNILLSKSKVLKHYTFLVCLFTLLIIDTFSYTVCLLCS